MKYSLLAALTLASSAALANWSLDNDASSLHFVTTKNVHVSEINHFGLLEGTLSSDGKLSVAINLASLDTMIDIRNTRMRDMLFDVANNQHATLTADISHSLFTMKAGETRQIQVEGNLSLMRKSKAIPFDIQVTKLIDNQLLATSIKPVLIDARDFGLNGGVDALQKIAGLSNISYTVPVSFNLIFKGE
ncbi:YceI family protein [Aestuariibacter sp. AA17]|uniref:YceI family protein n=1 Tax=Fluctibacter corallii TaxID=2984329 RepID=A0ABT3AAV9_9ALTE|nr:YceI family protein [Aestuariibacter sp. AA17]MCV2885814.1 YceI family protein [Aestuariibacter sp. AA17]